MMRALRSSIEPKSFTIPTRYGTVRDKEDEYLVMEKLEGQTIWELMGNGSHKLPESCANKIAAAVHELRQSWKFCDSLIKLDALTPQAHWYPQGPIFPYDNEGGRVVTGIKDFAAFMTARFKAAGVDLNAVPLTPRVITHGGLSPHNLKLCPDGTIGFMDLRTCFVGPTYPMFTNPLKEAMIRYGISTGDKIMFELDNNFRPWFAVYGGARARKEEEEKAKLEGDNAIQ